MVNYWSVLEMSVAGVSHLVPMNPGGQLHAMYLSVVEQVPPLRQLQISFSYIETCVLMTQLTVNVVIIMRKMEA